MNNEEELNDISQALRSLASLCRHGLLHPKPHDFDDCADRIEKVMKRGRTVYVLTQINKTNYPCTEPQDIRNWVFVSTKAAREKMKELFDKAPDQEINELRYWDAFKNSDGYEIVWTIKRAKIDEG